MKHLRLAIDQMAPHLGDIKANIDRHREGIIWAQREKADLIVFPELSLTGYLVRGMVNQVGLAPEAPGMAALARHAGEMGVILGFIEKAPDGQYYNSAAYMQGGRLQGIQRKLILPNYGMFEERRFYAAGDKVVPIDTPWGRMGIMICFDALHPAVAYLHEQAGARILVTISASPARAIGPEGEMGGREVFRIAQRAHARLCGQLAVFVNRVGTEEGLIFWGGSEVLDPAASVLCELPEYDEARQVVEIDLESIERARYLFPHLKEGRTDLILQELWRTRMGVPPQPVKVPE